MSNGTAVRPGATAPAPKPKTFKTLADLSSDQRDDSTIIEAPQTKDEIEKVVRDAKQRFRDTLPKGYLNEEEYRLYERLYGAPLRETTPEDVGIPEHADMGGSTSDRHGVLLRELADGEFEEVGYELAEQALLDGEAMDNFVIEKDPGYIELLARSDRERAALEQLQKDFEAVERAQEGSAYEAEEGPVDEDVPGNSQEESSWTTEDYPTYQKNSMAAPWRSCSRRTVW
ncbi:hypothetical protein NQ176_g11425 [Zarea fungicola]|uniref:Uncharacterized protein n=1 Tax=Zarea fungicola TaxID=93591 RepID=A0ACC1MCD6_9HYPO|nr:hypothetical protein NQ176_g11425 [Lecanicillium fungicola]